LNDFASENANVIKLWVKEGPNEGRYFKDGPPPQPLRFMKDGEIVEGMNEELERLSSAVPLGLEKLFPDGKILPYNLPHWLVSKNVFKVIPQPNTIAEVHIDIEKLFDAVHARGLNLLNEGQNQEGKELFEICASIVPTHPTAHYNLACAEALLGNPDAAIQQLVLAIENGYTNFEHMTRDSDLDSLRDLPNFQKLMKLGNREQKEEVVQNTENVPSQDVNMVGNDIQMECAVDDLVQSFDEISADEYAAQMFQLAEMGFHNAELNRSTLKRTNGSVVDAVQTILGIN